MPAAPPPIPSPSATIALQTGGARASIALTGAEPLTWHAAGHDLLWAPDPTYWSDTSPILFPIVGWAKDGQIMVDGQRRPMGVHGFAAAKSFTLVTQAADRATLRLADDDASQAIFPFRFELEVTYELRENSFVHGFEVRNPGAEPLPYALGVHPGFRWPFAGGVQSDYALHFARDEKPEVPIIAPGGLFSDQTRPIPLHGRTLPLSPELLAREALCLLNAASSTLRFAHKDGAAIEMDCQDFPHFAFWSRPGAPFLCLEAWTGHGDPVDFAGDIREKPSMRLLAPGSVARHAVTLRFHPAG